MKGNIVDINEVKIQNFIEENRPEDPEIRKELDLGYSFDGKAFELFEIRPIWINPKEKQELPFARIRYYKSRREWNLYWRRANGNWELYEPFPRSNDLDTLIEVISQDKYHCFFG